jgi:hypothetical protein
MKFFLPDPFEPRNPRKKLWWALGIAAVVGLFLSAGTLWRKGHELHARKLTAEGEALAAQGRTPEAFAKANRALSEASGYGRALRLAARALSAQNNIEAIKYWGQLCQTTDVTVEDREQFIQILLLLGDNISAEKQIDILLKQPEITLQTARLAAWVYERKQDRSKTIHFAREVLLREPRDEQMQFVLGRLFLASARPEEVLGGQLLLRDLVVNKDIVALEAIRLLAASPGLSAGDAQLCKLELAKSSFRAPSDEYVLADLEMVITPYKKAQIIGSVAARERNSQAENVALARWLGRNHEFSRVLQICPIEMAHGDHDALLVHVDALASLGLWKDLEGVLMREDLKLEPILKTLYQARAAKELNNTRIAKLLWEQVQALAKENRQWLLYVAQYAERMGENSQAMAAYRLMAREPGENGRRAYEGMIASVEKQGDTKTLRDMLQEASSAFPDDLPIRNDLAYVNLLLAENIPAAAKAAVTLVKTEPRFLSYRTTLALANLREGKQKEALGAYGAAKIDWDKAQPSWRAIYAAVLARNGKNEEAKVVLNSLDLARLKKEERFLVSEIQLATTAVSKSGK